MYTLSSLRNSTLNGFVLQLFKLLVLEALPVLMHCLGEDSALPSSGLLMSFVILCLMSPRNCVPLSSILKVSQHY